jgi:hypothetical protein
MSIAPSMPAQRAISGLAEVSIDASAYRRDDVVHLTLAVRIPDNAHIEAHEPPEPFLIPTVVDIDGLRDASIEYPEPQVKEIGVPGAELVVYQGTITIRARGRIDRTVTELTGTLRYQPCVGGACLPPRTTGFRARIEDVQAKAQRGAERWRTSSSWMLALGAVMAAEKNAPWGRRLSRPLGGALIASGLVTAVIAPSTPAPG